MCFSRSFLFLALGLFILFNQSQALAEQGSGNIIMDTRPAIGIKQVEVYGSGILHVIQGNEEKLELEVDDNLLPKFSITIDGDTLKISKKRFNSMSPTKLVIYRLYLKEIEEVEAYGSIKIRSKSLTFSEFDLELNGSAEVLLDEVEGREMEIEIKGSGYVSIRSGLVNELEADLHGSGNVKGNEFEVGKADIKLHGSGSTRLKVINSLKARIYGSGKVYYYGNPKVNSFVAGSGKIEAIESP